MVNRAQKAGMTVLVEVFHLKSSTDEQHFTVILFLESMIQQHRVLCRLDGASVVVAGYDTRVRG